VPFPAADGGIRYRKGLDLGPLGGSLAAQPLEPAVWDRLQCYAVLAAIRKTSVSAAIVV